MGGTLQIGQNDAEGPVLAAANVPAGDDWKVIKVPMSKLIKGVHNLFLALSSNRLVEVDWVSFE